MDDELSADARALIDVAMEQDVPPADHVEGSWGMVVSRLTLETSRAEPPPTPTPAAARSRLGLGVAVGVAAALGALLWLVLRPTPYASTDAGMAEAGPPTSEPPAAERPALDGTPTSGVAPVATLPSVAATSHVKLLVDAEAALPAEPARALALLDRHAELAPLADAERRMALRISTLCALGRADEAKSQANAFFATSRGSQWTARVRASCAG